MKEDVLRNLVKFTGKHLCQILFLNKVAGLRPETLLKKRLWHRRFPVNFVKLVRTPFLEDMSGRLPLNVILRYKFIKICREHLRNFNINLPNIIRDLPHFLDFN